MSALDDAEDRLKAASCAHFMIGRAGPFCRLGEDLGNCPCPLFVNLGATPSDLRRAIILAAGGQIAGTRPFALAKPLIDDEAEGDKSIRHPGRSDR
jgi:hypothetical protein